MLNKEGTSSRRHVALAGVLAVSCAAIALANPHFDEGNTSESLHLACTDLELKETSVNSAPEFHATCNSDTGTADASIDLGEGIGRDANGLKWDKIDDHENSCYDWEYDARSDGVYFRGECAAWASNTAGEDWTPWLNLNGGIKWNATTGTLEWR